MNPSFSQTVYAIVAAIPAGTVATYGQIAHLTGSPRASRIVGALMAKAPSGRGLPCHRVVYGNGALCQGDAFGAPTLQRQLLASEGVCFLPDGRVDLKKSQWQAPSPSFFDHL